MNDARERLEKFKEENSKYLNNQPTSNPVGNHGGVTGSLSDNKPKSDVDQKLLKLEEEIKSLKKENEKLSDVNSKIRDKDLNASKKIEIQKDNKAMYDVMSGFSSFFEKDYDFKVVDGDDIKFHIKMKPLPALDTITTVQNTMVDLTNGRNQYYDASYKFLLEAVAVIKSAAVDVPSWLLDLEHLNRIDILRTVYEDYLSWWDTFRQHASR